MWYGVIWFDVVRAFRVAGLSLLSPVSFWVSFGDLWCDVVWCGVIWFDVVPLFCVHDCVFNILYSLLCGSLQNSVVYDCNTQLFGHTSDLKSML